jgi:RecJ-like exonuclease
MKIRLCKICAKEFQSKHGKLFCSKECKRTQRRITRMEDYFRHREARLLSSYLWGKEHPEQNFKAVKAWRSKNPDGMKAQITIGNMSRRGKITYPDVCPKCGGSGKIHAHHPDYSKPKEVEFMCARCHKDEHRNLDEVN